jgi:hypothetical protein
METWMPLFVVVTALAVVLQAIVLIALFIQLRRTAARVEQTVADLNTKVTRLARGEAQKVDRVLSEALERLRMQLIHVDHVLTGAMEAVEDAGSRLRQTVWGPVVKATALIRGVQAGIDFFRTARQRRGPLDPGESSAEQQDEGMFI